MKSKKVLLSTVMAGLVAGGSLAATPALADHHEGEGAAHADQHSSLVKKRKDKKKKDKKSAKAAAKADDDKNSCKNGCGKDSCGEKK